MNTETRCKVWDLPLRLFHWLLVIAFFTAYLTEEDGLPVHVWAGYSVFGLLLFRLVWGFVGNDYARFANFLVMPATAFSYLKDLYAAKAKRYLGHNPAGAVMIVLLLVSLLGTVLTGFAVYGADQGAGPLAGIGSEYEDLWEEPHELFANFTLLLVIVHIIGVAVESYVHRENLARAMVHGYKRSDDETNSGK